MCARASVLRVKSLWGDAAKLPTHLELRLFCCRKNYGQEAGNKCQTECLSQTTLNVSQPFAVDYSETPLSILPSFLSEAKSESAANQSGM